MGQSLSICCNMLVKSLCLTVLVAAATAEDTKKSKHPKLFFVSSSSTTTTLSTITLCYSTSTSFTTTACGRKKRTIYTDPVTKEVGGLDLDDLIAPQAPKGDAMEDGRDDSHDDLVKSGQAGYEREGKFLLYWKTTTFTSTYTSYTATTTLGALECTPSSFALSECG